MKRHWIERENIINPRRMVVYEKKRADLFQRIAEQKDSRDLSVFYIMVQYAAAASDKKF